MTEWVLAESTPTYRRLACLQNSAWVLGTAQNVAIGIAVIYAGACLSKDECTFDLRAPAITLGCMNIVNSLGWAARGVSRSCYQEAAARTEDELPPGVAIDPSAFFSVLLQCAASMLGFLKAAFLIWATVVAFADSRWQRSQDGTIAGECNVGFYRIVAVCVIADWVSASALLAFWWCVPQEVFAKRYAQWYSRRKVVEYEAEAEARRAATAAATASLLPQPDAAAPQA